MNIERRSFLKLSTAALTVGPAFGAADGPMPMSMLGKTGMKVSRFCLGGYHIANKSDENGVRLVHRAIELGVNFFDSAQGYHKGRSDQIYGMALGGSSQRQKVYLMSKAIDRDRDKAMSQLEDTLRWMKTDYLDLWQCHMVSTQEEMDRIYGPNGALEAFVAAKRQGKVRHIGFSGHRDPELLVRFIQACDEWEVAQFPLNVVDPHYLSFLEIFLPAARKKGLGVITIKPNAFGNITGKGIASIEECLRFVLSQDVDAVVSGVDTLEHLEQNIAIVKRHQPMTADEQRTLLARTKKGPFGVEIEDYKKKPA